MATGTVQKDFIVIKKTLSNVTCNANVTSTALVGSAYIDVTSDIPSGYFPVIGALKCTSTQDTNEVVQCFVGGAVWRSIDSKWIMRVCNTTNVAKTLNGTLYILCMRTS